MVSKVELPDNDSSTFARPQDLVATARLYGAIEATIEDLVRVLETTAVEGHPGLIVTLEQTSDWIWREVQGVPVQFLPTLKACMRHYERTLVDLRYCILEAKPRSMEATQSLICRLEESIQALDAALQDFTLSKCQAPPSSSNANFFPDSRNISIAGGIFTINQVVPNSDSELHPQSGQISKFQFQIYVLFGSSGHKWWANNRIAWL
ncbi:hypothetical protein CPB83DRAFT_848938 [Crepidotus variabilis]|uniref:Uncharacterized protein n=1 Tax=Crepidotus variabilis TaxID=179855 RepID=A0A9P6EM44_9AGAR|nr:hypothetical protein CPB83DRAFT_848938 [Crepidotus variabilis]